MKYIKQDPIVLNGTGDLFSFLEGRILLTEYNVPNPVVPIFYRELKLVSQDNVSPLITGIRGRITPIIIRNHKSFEKSLLENKPLDLVDINKLSLEDFDKIDESSVILRTGYEEIYYTLDLRPIPQPITNKENTVLNSDNYNLASIKALMEKSPYLLDNIEPIKTLEIKVTPITIIEENKTSYITFSVLPSRAVLESAEKLCLAHNLPVTIKNLSTYLFDPKYLNDWLGLKNCRI